LVYCIAHCCVWLGQDVKGPYSFISCNFNYHLEPNNAVEHTDRSAIAPGPISAQVTGP
jgi:hypothetical protein